MADANLNENLNIVSESGLDIQLLDGDLNIIQKLDDEPNDVGGMTSAELKATFDKAGNIIKNYLNNQLVPAILAADATEAARAEAEAARQSAETGREQAETERVSAEEARASGEETRQSNETARKNAETSREDAETGRASAEGQRASAEGQRASAEVSRVTAEENRVTAEQNRAEAERLRSAADRNRDIAETQRIAAEEDRASAEAERAAAEQARASAEAERVAAEQARADENAGIVAQATEKAVEAASSAASAASSAADAESSAEKASASESAAADSEKAAGEAADSACADRMEAQYIARVIQHGQLPTDLPTNLILEAGKAMTYSATDTEPYTVPTVAKSLELGRRYQVLISGAVYAEFLWTGKTVYVGRNEAAGTYLVSVSGEMAYDQTTYKLTLQNGTMGFAPNSGRSLTVTLKAVDDSALPPVSQGIELDNTLTKEGKAADAAAVGDALSALSEEIAGIPSGKAGVGIQSVEQTTTSTEDGGTNIVTVTKTDGTTSTFSVRNGSKGSTGPAGADGKDGADGAAGPAGADGKSAYQIAVEGGYSGTEAEFNAALVDLPSHIANKQNPHGVKAAQVGAIPASAKGAASGVASLGTDGKVPESQLPEISAVKTYTATIGTTWTENEDTGVKSQNVAIDGVLAKHTAKVDHAYTGDGTSDGYAAFVEAENQYLTYITNGYAETYDGGIKFTIFGDANTVAIPIVAEVS